MTLLPLRRHRFGPQEQQTDAEGSGGRGFEDQKDSIKPISLASSVVGKAIEEKIDVVKSRLARNHGYDDRHSEGRLGECLDICSGGASQVWLRLHRMLDETKLYRRLLSEEDRIGIGTFQPKDNFRRATMIAFAAPAVRHEFGPQEPQGLRKGLDMKRFEGARDTSKHIVARNATSMAIATSTRKEPPTNIWTCNRAPRSHRTAYQRLYDMILSHGTNEVFENKEKIIRYKFFTDYAAKRGDGIYGIDRPPINAFNFHGELNIVNRGLVEFIEALKLDVTSRNDHLGVAQEHKIKTSKSAQTNIDEVILGVKKEPEYRRLQNNEFIEALRDRTVKINIPPSRGARTRFRS